MNVMQCTAITEYIVECNTMKYTNTAVGGEEVPVLVSITVN